MAAQPGEENVATLFADIHYFYGPETENPPHHRFNKGSYVYLFENAQAGRARIEVANQPGTEHQDAFDGFLDRTAVCYSYKHSCKVSLTVADVPNQDEWHLPTYDPHNQNIYHYKLQSLDIYFWTQRDALQFVNGVRRVLPPTQVDVQDEPAPPPPPPVSVPVSVPVPAFQAPAQPDAMSSVVRKLENAALIGAAAPAATATAAPSFAPPPLSAVSADNSHAPAAPSNGTAPQQQPPAGFVPIPYNPAAPPAPETIRPREKTPPPEDVGVGHFNPLHQTLANDANTPFSPGLIVPTGLGPLSPGVPPPAFHMPPGVPSFPGPPSGFGHLSPGLPPPPPSSASLSGVPQLQHPGLVRAATMPIGTPPTPFSPSAIPPDVNPANPSFPASPAFSASSYTTAAQVIAPATTPTPPTAGLPASPPPASYSQYTYMNSVPGAVAGAGAGGGHDYSIHQQVYRPAGAGGDATTYKPKQEARGRLEENAARLERGMTGMLKKFEKKFG